MALQARYVVQKAPGIGGPPIPADEPCLVIRAQDILALSVMHHYLTKFVGLTGADSRVMAELMSHRDAITEWQAEHGAKVADR